MAEHWGNIPGGERVRHEGEQADCTENDCPKGQAVSAEGRVKLFVSMMSRGEDTPLAAEFMYNRRFKSPEWDMGYYALQADDLTKVLQDLSMAREIRDANADRFEREQKNNRTLIGNCLELVEEIKGLKGQLLAKEELEERLSKKIDQLAEETTKLIKAKDDTIAALRRSGGEHWFRYAYQKVIEKGGPFVDHCGDCHKPRGDSAHFLQKSVQDLVREAQDRIFNMLVGIKFSRGNADSMARELLGDLPGLKSYADMVGEEG